MTRITMTLALTGRVGAYTVIADDALEELADRMRAAPAPTVALRLGDRRVTAAVDPATVRIVDVPPDRQALIAEVELPDGEPILAPAPPLTGIEVTDADRAAQMRRLDPPEAA